MPAIWRVACVVTVGAWLASAAHAEQDGARTLIEWRFDTPGQMHGWAPNPDWPEGRIAEGCWSARITGKDPILLGPILKPALAVTDRDFVEVRCRCSQRGKIQFFFTQTLEGRFGGFFRDRSVIKALPASDEWRTIRMWPSWARYKKIVRLRLDGPVNTGRFDLASIAVRRATRAPGPETAWDLRDPKTAQRFCDATLNSDARPTADGVRVQGRDGPPVLTLDHTRVPAKGRPWLVVTMNASVGPFGGFTFDTPARRSRFYTWPIRADGKMHTYNCWLGDYHLVAGPQPQRRQRSHWRGLVRSISLIPTYEPGAAGAVASVSFEAEPRGRPLLVVDYCGPADSLYRAGKRGPIALRVHNVGGAPARRLRVEISPRPGLSLVPDSLRGMPEQIGVDAFHTVYADVTGARPGRHRFDARVSCEGGEPTGASGVVRVEPAVDLARGAIPEPRPVKTDYDIGVYYFPGWWHLHHWVTIPAYAERRPLLGYYDEASPTAADWDIKWAVEHGVDHFVVEWWWNKGKIWGEGWLETGLLKSRFVKHIRFCVMWNNPSHFEPWSEQDFVNLTDYWIKHYFPHPSYKRHTDGRPVAYVLRANNFVDDFGADGMKRLMAGANARARRAGFPGIYWVACTPRGRPEDYIDAGYEATTLYNYCATGALGYPTAPARLHLDLARKVWDEDLVDKLTRTLPISTNFEHRPWFGRRPGRCNYGFTPALFEKHLRDAKAYLDARGEKSMVIEAWNEWGEGSSLGPHALYGFDLLEAVARVFAPNAAPRPPVGPDDVGVYAPEIPDIWTITHRPAFEPQRK